MLCSTISTVRLAATFLISCVTRSTSSWPMPCVGSSSSISFGLHRQRGGDLQRALAAVGQLHGHDRRRKSRRPTVSSSSQRAVVQRVERRARSFQKWKDVPSLRCSAMRTFSSTVRCGKMAEIWNERMMPRRAICAGFSLRDVLAVEQDLPARGRQELGQQVEARSSCRRRWGRSARGCRRAAPCRSTPSTATKPLNSLTSSRVSRM